MFYALTVVTLLATILFYSFYPRNDGIKTVDMPREKAIMTQFVAQHNAAVEAARVVTYDPIEGKNRMAYETWVDGDNPAMRSGNVIPHSLYRVFLPAGFQYGYEYTEGAPIWKTELWCVDNADRTLAGVCALRKTNDVVEYQSGTTDLIVSYMTPDNTLQYRALGELVFLTPYTEGEHLKTNCGISVCNDGWCTLSNTRYTTIQIPQNADIDGKLVCVTLLSVAYDEDRHMQEIGG